MDLKKGACALRRAPYFTESLSLARKKAVLLHDFAFQKNCAASLVNVHRSDDSIGNSSEATLRHTRESV